MIIGNGLLARKFVSYSHNDDFLIFAAGVSNSKESLQSEFEREKELLLNTMKKNSSKKIIYFSTCSMYDTYFQNNNYVNHKLEMESLIATHFKKYLILRLPQVVGKNNQSQLTGFLYKKILNDETFELYDIERNIIDISDIKTIVDYILTNNLYINQIINIANPRNIKVTNLVKIFENLLYKKAKYSTVKIHGSFNIDISNTIQIIHDLKLFDKNYEEKIIGKYYG